MGNLQRNQDFVDSFVQQISLHNGGKLASVTRDGVDANGCPYTETVVVGQVPTQPPYQSHIQHIQQPVQPVIYAAPPKEEAVVKPQSSSSSSFGTYAMFTGIGMLITLILLAMVGPQMKINRLEGQVDGLREGYYQSP